MTGSSRAAREGPFTGEACHAVAAAAANIVLFSLAAVGQWAVWAGSERMPLDPTPVNITLRAVGTFVASALPGLAVVLAVFALRPLTWSWPRRLAVTSALAVVGSLVRLQILLWERHGSPGLGVRLIEAASAAGGAIVAICLALAWVDERARLRREEQRRLEQEHRAARALADLEHEELRIRRQVSRQLHGSVQQRLVILGVQIDDLAAELGAAGLTETGAQLRELAQDIDTMREEQVRELSQMLFPAGADIGTGQALQIMLERLPRSVKATLTASPELAALGDPTRPNLSVSDRLVVLSTIEEAITNALKHGKARNIAIHGDLRRTDDPRRSVAILTVDDDGSGLPDGEPVLHGLARQRDRVEQRGGTLSLVRSPRGGARLVLEMPFTEWAQQQ